MTPKAAPFRLVHALPTRLRFKWPQLRQRRFDRDFIVPYLQRQAGVRQVRVDPQAYSLVVHYDGEPHTRKTLIGEMLRIARDPACVRDTVPEIQDRQQGLGRVVVLGTLLAATPFLPPTLRGAASVATLTPALFKGVKTLIQRGVRAEVLDAASVSVSALQGDYFTANATHFMLETGEYLEGSAVSHSDKLLSHLMKPDNSPVRVLRDEAEVRVPADEIRVGDTIVVGAGERIPIDGHVLKGEALVNQANMTGESLPVTKAPGERAISGTVLTEGQLQIWAEQVGGKTATAKVSRFITHAVQNKGEMQRLTESLSDKLVPVTLGLSTAVYGVTRDLTRTAAVLQADYACALKLVTPVAVKSAIYNGAQHGILIKGGQAFEQLARADTFVFDKTGTLTHSQLEVTDVISLTRRWDSEGILNLAASAEEHYFHPVAEAVVRAAANQPFKHIDHGEVDFMVAHGLTTHVAGQEVHIGSQHFLQDHHRIGFDAHRERLERLRTEGKTLLFIAMDNALIGIIGLLDRPRPDAAQTLSRLKALGVERIVMLTGDHRTQAMTIAEGLPIDEVYYELEPEEKVTVIERLREAGREVAFIGDGVNDAPALTAASVGISMQYGADIAREIADVSLLIPTEAAVSAGASVGISMQYGADIAREIADVSLLIDSLSAVADARAIARETMNTVNNNFRTSVGVNTLLLMAAGANLLSPIATSLLHNGTTLAMLGYSIRLRTKRLPYAPRQLPGPGRSGKRSPQPLTAANQGPNHEPDF